VSEYTFNLSRLWVVVCLICLIDLALLPSLLIGVPRPNVLFGWMPGAVSAAAFLYGPFIFAALWLVVVVIAAVFHGRRGLLPMITAFLIVPLTYLHYGLVWNCAVSGQCL
jgi:hypothetical protein